ncbi:MAG: shikimate kinase [Candidatus Odinarchaeum yellowstonii]|uniref:Shikimate kinase n=1 Tax=Odinarchaeota yellowstonii (strain LCB_4) TaxID=1841599 RepID=A0AAF0D2H9_ODILC|nr:MAG: shikimate kinase [Candidatus Odinarchaeum yellowstonii]
MNKRAAAISHGAVTVINAIAAGVGSAIGVDLWTRAEVEILPEEKYECIIPGFEDTDTKLMENCARKVFEKYNIRGYGARIITYSNIPIGKGLKSSSAAANAVVLATVKALDVEASDIEIIKMGVEAAIESKVTVTGAFDDAAASYFGGLVLTDNIKREIILRKTFTERIKVALLIPDHRVFTRTPEAINKTKLIGRLIPHLIELVKKGKVEDAMNFNGFLYGACYGTPMEIIFKALEGGAKAVSVSGTGPTVAALIDESETDSLKKAWSGFKGEVRIVNINNSKATATTL